ncbi:MAG: hypothetical protein Q8R35_03045 [bacterium]|nr:hypothetical protein [bacterium]
MNAILTAMGIPAHGVFALKRQKKILIPVFALLAVIGALVWIASKTTPAAVPIAARPQDPALAKKIAAEAAKDGDHDGLKDWEEAIWQTDAAKADSDDDGTPDGDEVATNRDPRIAGPNDQYSPTADADPNAEGQPAPDNLTAQIGARITADLVTSGGDVERLDIKALADDYAEGLAGVRVLDSAPQFSGRDLAPAPANDILTILKFFGAIDEVWAKHFKPSKPTDLEVFFEKFERDEGAGVEAALAPHEEGYREAIERIKKTPVPKEFEPFAVSFLNYLSKIHRSVGLMSGFTTDPLAAMLAVRERLALNEEFDAFIKKTVADAEPVIRNKVAEFAAQQKR